MRALIAIAAALGGGIITAWRTARFGRPAFAMMVNVTATGIAWAVLVVAEGLLSFAFG